MIPDNISVFFFLHSWVYAIYVLGEGKEGIKSPVVEIIFLRWRFDNRVFSIAFEPIMGLAL